jgi:erythronate-4-phosphate dehydrogenase
LEDTLQAAVFPVYDVLEDDKRLRGLLQQPSAKQGAFFDDLRKTYPIRREFANTRITLATPAPDIARKLSALEFVVED